MRLTRFQLSGFKSFAKPTELEFPQPITAIVGPNGSGKSNIAEGIRWALGEQSMKILRGKKGEDLIFNGSPEAPRMGKASVRLYFDNHDGRIPLDFAEVVFERKIFRDGTNEYYLNDSQVRLKDVVEILARMGLGETKHNIIGQGEVDRVLITTPRERREMLEEAIGLRVYQLKKVETERKLDETSKNIMQAWAILKEISPHLKFLRLQAEKAEQRSNTEFELRKAILAWIIAARRELEKDFEKMAERHGPEEKRLLSLENEIDAVKREITEAEAELSVAKTRSPHENQILALEKKRQELERELGRIEGKIESAASPQVLNPTEKVIEIKYVRRHIAATLDSLEEIHAIDDLEEVRERIESLITSVESLLAEMEEQAQGASAESTGENERNLRAMHEKINKELQKLQDEIERIKGLFKKETEDIVLLQEKLRAQERALREKEEERSRIQSSLQRWLYEKERLAERRKEIDEEEQRFAPLQEEFSAIDKTLAETAVEELRRRIEKYRIKLEEVGGIDPQVIKEYEDTKARHAFLEGEIKDLEAASRDLRALIKELDENMKRDFESGFNKIREEFNNYFRIIFGGGKGVLRYAPIQTQKNEEDSETAEIEYGVEIDVDVPRKRIHSIAMLSGGERALTSIALLFAITAVNPPPFLVLDETDSALDEANSQKYAAILKELSKKTQLILITHNRETMKASGVLYGVTMGSDGVSKLLSLKLEEAEAYTNR